MTDTPRVPSEATTGNPPPAEALAGATPGATPAVGAEPTPPAAADAEAADADAVVVAAAEATDATEAAEAETPASAPDSPSAASPDETPGNPPDQPAAVLDPAADPAPVQAPTRSDLSPAACAALLAEHFPALFGGAPRPLKLRIQADIQERAPGVFTRKALSVFLHRYTTSNAYLNALVKAPQRVDLDGTDAGEIADEHRAAASEELARRRSVHDTRRREARAAENAARRAVAQGPGTADVPGKDGAAPATDGDAAASPAAGPTQPAPHPAREARRERPPAGRRDSQAAGRGDRRPEGRQDRRPAPPAGTGQALRPTSRQTSHPEPRVAGPAEHGPEARGEAGRSGATQATGPAPQPPWSEAERERAALLRAYEGSTLTRANFCVLKRIAESTLEAQLLLARQERALRPAPAARADARHDERPDHRPAAAAGRGGRDGHERAGRGAGGGGRPDGAPGPRRPRPSGPGR